MRFNPLLFLEQQRFFTTKFGVLTLVVLMAFGSQGCSDTEEQAPGDARESQLPSIIQESPDRQQPFSGPGEETDDEGREGSNGLMEETEPQVTRQAAQEELTNATEAVGKVQQLLHQAPIGKESDLALSALQQDFESARDRLQTAQAHFNDQEFRIARAQARAAKEQATSVAQHLERAINSVNVPSP
jgi:hypothetical protein